MKLIHDAAIAQKLYAKIAKDKAMEINALEIRIRAEDKLDELIKAQAKTVGLAKAGRPPKNRVPAEPNSSPKPAFDRLVDLDRRKGMVDQIADRADEKSGCHRFAGSRWK